MVEKEPAELAGRRGELVERLMAALVGDGRDEWLQNIGFVVAANIGGVEGAARGFVPASSIRRRLLDVIGTGVDERFLVRALRDVVTEFLTAQAETHKADENRAVLRAQVEESLDDPIGLERIREDRPEHTAGKSDEELRTELRRFADRLRPVDADEATQKWQMFDRWTGFVAEYVNDEDLERWNERRFLNELKRRRGGGMG